MYKVQIEVGARVVLRCDDAICMPLRNSRVASNYAQSIPLTTLTCTYCRGFTSSNRVVVIPNVEFAYACKCLRFESWGILSLG